MFDPNANGTYNNFRSSNFSIRGRKSIRDYENYVRLNYEDIQFRADDTRDDSDVCSPPLWKSSPSNNHGILSPDSRVRAIAKGQLELMEMARNMPESCYELSLRDMVESPKVLDDEERSLVEVRDFEARESVKEIKKQESKRVGKRVERVKSANLENGGLLLKMVFPLSLGWKRKKSLAMRGGTTRVLPKAETLNKSSMSEKDWWKKKFSGSSGSESGVTSTSSGSSKSTSSDDSNRSRRLDGKFLDGVVSEFQNDNYPRRRRRQFRAPIEGRKCLKSKVLALG